MQHRAARQVFALIPLFAAMIVASCGQDSVVGPRIATLSVVSGSGQSAPVGSTLPAPLVVIVVDQAGAPVQGVPITWSILSGGGTVTPGTSTTGTDGKASASLRVGNSTGAITVEASLGNLQPVTFLATAVTAPATKLTIAGGDLQSGAVATALLSNLAVLVTDAVDTPKPGVVVTFTVSTGGGSLSAGSATTDAAGIASVKWTLGTVAGVQTVIALATGIAPVNFSATATAGAPNALTILTGNNQTGGTNSALPDSLRVRLLDKFGNGIPGVAIVFAPGAGSGTVSPLSSLTDVTGRAATKWTLGATGGQANVTATGGGFVAQFSGGANFKYKAVSAGAKHSCGLDEGGVAYCWGYDGDGQLGIGIPPGGSGPIFAHPVPTASTGDLTFSQLIGGSYHTCALTLSGVGECWGVNVDGRLGTGSFTDGNAPLPLLRFRAFAQLSNGQAHSCALDLSGIALCWGRNVDGQLGVGLLPTPIQNEAVDSPMVVLGGMNYGGIAAGGLHSCGLQRTATPFTTGVAWCWGNNQAGQLGDGGANPGGVNVPVAVVGGISFSAIATGNLHTCGIDGAGAVWCWGLNNRGQLGDNTTTNRNVPTPVTPPPGGPVFVSISAGAAHTCAVTNANVAYCWGDNTNGQLGEGSAPSVTLKKVPTIVTGGLAFASVSAGTSHTCGLTLAPTNTAYCWGDNQFGQLGIGSVDQVPSYRSSPLKVLFQP